MTDKGKATHRCSGWSVLLALPALALFALTGCTPDIKQEPPPQYAEMEFDPTGTPPSAPEPTALLINPQTGLIDFSLVGIDVPADCAGTLPSGMSVAQCEFYQFLESLDGFPTLTTTEAPASEPLNLDTVPLVTASNKDGNLLITAGAQPITDVTVGFDTDGNYLTIDPDAGWGVGETLVFAVRGYANGVKTESGKEVIGSLVMLLLKQDNSLTCGAEAPADISADCPYLKLVLQQYPPPPTSEQVAEARASLVLLEAIREQLSLAFMLVEASGIPKEEVAVLWAFPTHSNSVAQLDPTRGMVPEVVGDNELRIAVNGSVNPGTVLAFTLTTPGTVVLIDLTVLATVTGPTDPKLAEAFPAATATYTAPDIAITLDGTVTFVDGHMYAVVLFNNITNTEGLPLVPSPVTVLLRSTGSLVEDGTSTVSQVSDAQAALLEPYRQQLAPLLDQLAGLSQGQVTRANVAYLYAFTYPNPLPSP